MLCSTPVLSSNAGCAKKIINNNRFVMSNNDYSSIIKNLNKTINIFKFKRKEWNLLKKNCRLQIKKNFSIQNMANTYMKNWIFR
jgi:glycosyltransferase involved in cell wall biosynthesis